MFTGIIEAIGSIHSSGKNELFIRASFVKSLKLGQSVAMNGACLTVVERDRQCFRVELLEETKKLTNLAALKKGDLVNLERAMKIGDRLDGHLVQGHVEGLAVIKKIVQEKVTLQVPKKLLKYLMLKGMVILDGIALTITGLNDRKAEIQVAITAYTWENTNLKTRKVGDRLNLETDLIGKFIERLL